MIHLIYKFCLIPLITLVFISYLGKWNWLCDILSNFRLYYIFAGLVFLILALISKDTIGTSLLLAIIVIQTYTVYQSYAAHPYKVEASDIYEDITLLQYNVHFLNKNDIGVVDYLLSKQTQLDIIFLQEVRPELKLELRRLEKYFPYKIAIDDQWFGRAIYSKLPILSHEIKFFDNQPISTPLSKSSKDSFFGTNIHYLIVQLKTKELSIPITFYGIHTTAPFSQEHAERRNHELSIIAREINQNTENTHKILAGDFNVASSSYWYKLLEKSTNLVSAERGTGINNTWPSWLDFNLMRISIDNALVSDNIIVEKRIIGENIDSDHLPVILKLKIIQ